MIVSNQNTDLQPLLLQAYGAGSWLSLDGLRVKRLALAVFINSNPNSTEAKEMLEEVNEAIENWQMWYSGKYF